MANAIRTTMPPTIHIQIGIQIPIVHFPPVSPDPVNQACLRVPDRATLKRVNV
jgi:hypothetical protein